MALEDTLSSIDTTLKAILCALVSGNSAVAQLGVPEAAAKPSATKGTANEVRFYTSKDGTAFYRVEPGQTPPKGATEISEQLYEQGKADPGKKSSDAAAAGKGAGTGPSATAKQGDASGPTFKDVVEALTKMSKEPEPKGGRNAVTAILAKYLPDLEVKDRKVPKLEALDRNAEIIADVTAALADEPAAEDDDPFA